MQSKQRLQAAHSSHIAFIPVNPAELQVLMHLITNELIHKQ